MSARHRIAVALACLAAAASPMPAMAHSMPGGEELVPGQFRVRPLITIEGHAGLENNLEYQPQHYALDGLFGAVFEWGLGRGGRFAVEAQLGPALVWGEAEHFYGRVHVEPQGGDAHAHGDAHAEGEHDEEEFIKVGEKESPTVVIIETLNRYGLL